MDDRIMDIDGLLEYARMRLLWTGSEKNDLATIRKIILEYGHDRHEFLKGHDQVPIDQRFAREPIIIEDGNLFVPIYDGRDRLERYRNMVKNVNLTKVFPEIELEIRVAGGSYDAADRRIRGFARSAVGEIFDNGEVSDHLFIGPLRTSVDAFFADEIFSRIRSSIRQDMKCKALDRCMTVISEDRMISRERLLSNAGVLHLAKSRLINDSKYSQLSARARDDLVRRIHHRYLDYQYLNVRPDLQIVGVNYAYGDQMSHFLSEFLNRYEGDRLNLLIYGKVGGLVDGARRGDIIVPDMVWKGDESHTFENRYLKKTPPDFRYRLEQYGVAGFFGGAVHDVDYVLEQDLDDLLLAKKRGAICTEMEVIHAVRAIEEIGSDIDVRLHFVGYVSDMPLEGDNLSVELSDYRGIYRAIMSYRDIARFH